jgi:hypothetical protein
MSHVRMLRESAIAFNVDLDIRAVVDDRYDSGVPGGALVLHFVDAVMTGTPSVRESARGAIIDALGTASRVDAAGVFANFQMMNRVAEGTGMPVPGAAIEREADMVESLGLSNFYKH